MNKKAIYYRFLANFVSIRTDNIQDYAQWMNEWCKLILFRSFSSNTLDVWKIFTKTFCMHAKIGWSWSNVAKRDTFYITDSERVTNTIFERERDKDS